MSMARASLALMGVGLAATVVSSACGPPFSVIDCYYTDSCSGLGGSPDSTSEAPGLAGDGAGGAEGIAAPPDATDDVLQVVRITPGSDARGVESEVTITVRFDRPLVETSVTNKSVRLVRNSAEVDAVVSYQDGAVRLVPVRPLALLERYDVNIDQGVTGEAGETLKAPYSSTFEVRDGAWEVSTVVEDDVASLPPTLPMNKAGDFALLWSGSKGQPCPVRALDVRRGKPLQAPVELQVPTGGGGTTCASLRVAGNADGALAATWSEPDKQRGSWVALRQGGAWGSAARVGDEAPNGSSSISLAPDGSLTLFADGVTVTSTWQADTSGRWSAGQTLSSETATSTPSAVYDVQGNGVAVWRSFNPMAGYERILSAQLRRTGGVWSLAEALPGSMASSPGKETVGIPNVAVDSGGGAWTAWVSNDNALLASHFNGERWETPVRISGTFLSATRSEPPALVFDGESFWVAWTGTAESFTSALVSRYDSASWSAPQQLQRQVDGASSAKMPRLVSDGRGNLLLVWVKAASSAGSFPLLWRRYTRGSWGDINEVPNGNLLTNSVDADSLPLAMNESGVATCAWLERSQGKPKRIRLASFH